MRPAGHFEDQAIGTYVNPVISSEGVGVQVSRVPRQEQRRTIPLAILREVIDVVRKRGGADVHPEPSLVAAWVFAAQHCHWCVIGPDHRGLAHQLLLTLVQWPQ